MNPSLNGRNKLTRMSRNYSVLTAEQGQIVATPVARMTVVRTAAQYVQTFVPAVVPAWSRGMHRSRSITSRLVTVLSSVFISVLIVAKEWRGSFYRRTTLKDLGLIVQLGHAIGDSCLRPADNSRSMVVIDIDGIHEVSVNFCGCHRAEAQYIQLLRTRWFPATVDLPRTAVTFRALNHFQMLTFMSKVSAYEYYHTLSRLTDNTGVHPPPVCYFWKDRLRMLLN